MDGLYFVWVWFQFLATFYHLIQHKIQEIPPPQDELFNQTWVIILKLSLLDTMPQEE